MFPCTYSTKTLLSAALLIAGFPLFAATITSNQTGNWSDGTTWVGGSAPNSGDNVIVAATHTVTINQDVTVFDLTINASGTLTEDGGSRRISIQNNGSFTNNGTFTSNTETIDFEGAGKIDGSSVSTVNNVELNGSLTVTTAPTINGTLEIKSGGSVTAAPNYGTNSTLKYNIGGGGYNRWKEWDDTDSANPGFPHHVHITGSTPFNLKNGTNANRYCGGDLTIDAGSTLDQEDNTGNLSIGGDLTINGTLDNSTTSNADVFIYGDLTIDAAGAYNPNDRSLVFGGTQDPQLLTDNAGNNWDYFSSHKTSGYVKLMTNLTIASNKWFTLHNGGGVDLNDKTLTLESNAKFNAEYNGNSNIINSGSGTATVVFEGGSTFDGSDGVEEIVFGTGVKIESSGQLGNLHYTTVNGTLEFKSGGYPNGNGPVWGSSSTVICNMGGTHNYGSNWNNLWNNTLYNWTIESGTKFGFNSDGTISSAATVTVNGEIEVGDGSANRDMDFTNVVIGASGVIDMGNTSGSDLFISGDFAVTSGGTFQMEDRMVEFDGSGTQTISGDFGAQSMDYVNINNSHATQGVELECDIKIDNELRLIDGYLFTKDNYITFDGTSGYCDGAGDCNDGDGDADSHIVCDGDGGVKLEDYAGSDTWTFPVASAPGEYDAGKGVYVDDLNDNISSGTLSCGLNTDLTMGGDDDEILNPTEFVQTLYYLSHSAGVGDGVEITLYWHTSDEGGAFTRGSAEMYHLDGSDDWVDENATTGGSGSHYYVQEEVSSFSPFAVGDQAPAILPVEWAYIDCAIMEGGWPVIRWQTASELNNDHFVIERSEDGIHFTAVGQIAGQGTTSQFADYEWVDDTDVEGTYYRIKQVDFDGQYDYSEVVRLPEQKHKTPELNLWPNPATEGTKVMLSYGRSAEAMAIYDLAGQLVWRYIDQLNVPVQLPNLRAGNYLIHVTENHASTTKRLIVLE